MTRTTIRRVGIAMAAMLVGAAMAWAHNGIEHVMGAVTALAADSITVETVKHTRVTVIVGPFTTYTHGVMKMALKDLKKGERVVINAKEDDKEKLQGVSVRWGTGSAAKAAHADHKM